ncbi:MarR family winged helix-turn-helix transcriptional regulator [Leucobacter triazinivorans]|uniref:MarR family transcriptional regulator n=1 Tax=Leucobacter triazinivorans TaxID=1784719 RepID=A0A4P6KF60_9MICO|nr:MarR family transcriptional regulator [Leucobacter triazinivorans]QBE49046.1 MarR family transcriptional regulator [Leucobacter triazinivorans]
MDNEATQAELLGELGERVVEIFRVLQPEVLVDRPGLIAVTRSESEIMRFLMAEPGATVTHMARVFGQHKSNTSTRVAALVEKGLVRKSTSEGDGREVRIHPTELAVKNFASYREIWAERLADAVVGREAELADAVALLRALAENLARERNAEHLIPDPS